MTGAKKKTKAQYNGKISFFNMYTSGAAESFWSRGALKKRTPPHRIYLKDFFLDGSNWKLAVCGVENIHTYAYI